MSTAQWHPTNKNLFMTAAEDATIRFWDVNSLRKQFAVIFSRSAQPGVRMPIDAAAFSHDGKLVAGATRVGAIRLWATTGGFHRHQTEIPRAHANNSETSAVIFSADDRYLASRGGDDTLKGMHYISFSIG